MINVACNVKSCPLNANLHVATESFKKQLFP